MSNDFIVQNLTVVGKQILSFLECSIVPLKMGAMTVERGMIPFPPLRDAFMVKEIPPSEG